MQEHDLRFRGKTVEVCLQSATPLTTAGANSEVLSRLNKSLVSRNTSASASAELVSSLLQAPERFAELRSRARAAIDPALGWHSVADHHMALYERHLPDG